MKSSTLYLQLQVAVKEYVPFGLMLKKGMIEGICFMLNAFYMYFLGET